MAAEVQTNLLGYILTKLHADVARIESLIHQVHTDVDYLVQARQISDDDAQLILSKVPPPIHVDPAPAPPQTLVQSGSALHVTALPTPILNTQVPPAPSPSQLPQPTAAQPPPQPQQPTQAQSGGAAAKRAVPPPPKKVQARALWDYNVDGEEPKDLTFYKDDIIEIISETNADWWTGKVNGRTGLFPSNYVEKLVHPLPPALANASHPTHLVDANQQQSAPPPQGPQYVPYRSTHAAMAPPPGGGPNPIGLQPAPQQEQEEKKSKYSHLKSTMANSAAGGLGFGAGAAIGGGLVRAIF